MKNKKYNFLLDNITRKFNKLIKSNMVSFDENKGWYYDRAYGSYLSDTQGYSRSEAMEMGKNPENILNTLIEFDPTENKEYTLWLITQYNKVYRTLEDHVVDYLNKRGNMMMRNFRPNIDDVIKDRNFPIQNPFELGGIVYMFFEDLPQIASSIKTLEILKKSNILTKELRDINSYEQYNNFVSHMSKYSASEDDEEVYLFNAKELQQINKGNAIKVGENDKYVVIATLTLEANQVFADGTVWCTKNDGTFQNYTKDGKLYILIRKGKASRKLLYENSKYRMQFHFGRQHYMGSRNDPINFQEFINANKDLKGIFKDAIIDSIKQKQKNKHKNDPQEIINEIKSYGYEEELIDILKNINITKLRLEHITDEEVLNRLNELKNIKDITLSNNDLTKLPSGLFDLAPDLEGLILRDNKNLQEFGDRFYEFCNLRKLTLKNLGDVSHIDLSYFKKLETLVLQNNMLSTIPKGLGDLEYLHYLDLSSTNIKEITDKDLENLKSLQRLFLTNCKYLEYITPKIGDLPNFVGIITTGSNNIRNKEELKDKLADKFTDLELGEPETVQTTQTVDKYLVQ